MVKQLNVQQQNEETKAGIVRVASIPPAELPWLADLLRSNGLSLEKGLLVRLAEVPEQGGNFFQGIWLTDEHAFWQFKVTVSRTSQEALEIEDFRDVSSLLAAIPSSKGTGASFAFLALQVLRETHGT